MPTHHPGPEHRRAAHSPSGEAPSPAGSSGGTCRHWAHHAKCAFGEQCKHAHRMPRREDLGRVGLVSYPGWYMESAFSLYSLLHWCRGSVVQYLRQYEPAMMTALEQIHAKIAGDADAPPLPDVSFSVPEPETPTPPPAPRQDCFGTAGPVPGGVDSRPWMYKNGGHHSTEQPGSCPPYRGKAIKPARRWGPQFGGWKQGPQGNHYRSYDIMEGAKRKGRTSQAAAKRNQGGMVMVGF
ncbi:hypothetical protein F4775DRAFT_543993 [Biscogniauxia sp. FL1348]|nr:hypothetical protein F4775DRAFT_543993 [Biscogniauxia sp. FL1348]